MNYFWAFVTGGAICVVGQLLLDLTALTPARILTGYVVAGVVLSALGGTRRWPSLQAAVPPFPCWLRASACQRRAHRPCRRGSHRHPDRRADRRCCRRHHQPCLRRGLFAGGPQPRPELKQNSSWDDTLFSCIVLFCADSRPLHGILFQKRR